jgi:hypothetical protein
MLDDFRRVALAVVVALAASGCVATKLPPAPDWEGLSPSVRAVLPGSGGPLLVIHGSRGRGPGSVSEALRRSGVFSAVDEVFFHGSSPEIRIDPPAGGWKLELERFDDGGRQREFCMMGHFLTLGLFPCIGSGDWTYHYRLSPGAARGGATVIAVPGSTAEIHGWIALPLLPLHAWAPGESSDDVTDRMVRHLLRGMVEAGVGTPVR